MALDLEGGRISRARIALGSVAHKPWRLGEAERSLAGVSAANQAEIRGIIDASFSHATPLTHNAYKIVLAKNATERAITLAARTAS